MRFCTEKLCLFSHSYYYFSEHMWSEIFVLYLNDFEMITKQIYLQFSILTNFLKVEPTNLFYLKDWCQTICNSFIDMVLLPQPKRFCSVFFLGRRHSWMKKGSFLSE